MIRDRVIRNLRAELKTALTENARLKRSVEQTIDSNREKVPLGWEREALVRLNPHLNYADTTPSGAPQAIKRMRAWLWNF